jgi:hypothetical protein
MMSRLYEIHLLLVLVLVLVLLVLLLVVLLLMSLGGFWQDGSILSQQIQLSSRLLILFMGLFNLKR